MKAEVCVIGSGAGGAAVASELARRGRRVVLLELGRRLDTLKDFRDGPQDETGLPKAFRESEAWAPHGSGPAARLAPGRDALRSFNLFAPLDTAKDERPPAQVHRAFGLGGSTLRFQGCSDRWPAEAFRGTPLEGVDLSPWYARAEELLRVHGPRPCHRFPPHPLGRASQRLVDPFRRAGLHLEPAALAILAQADPATGRAACDRRNRCSSGCPVGAKSSYDLALLDPVLASHPGRLQVVTRALATRLVPQAGRPERIAAVEYVDLSQLAPSADSPERLEADVFIVAGGPVETPRLLLLSACRPHPDGIGNAEGQVGRYACESLHLGLVLLFNEPLASHLGPSMESVAEARVGGKPGLVTVTQEALALVRPWDYAQRVTESWWGAARLREIAANYGHAVGLLGECAQEPAPGNRISLAPALKDPLGRPAARLTGAHSAGDLEQLAALREKVHGVAAETKARVVEQFSAYDAPPGGAELHGSCRMHSDPRQGGVDANQRVHGMENLYISDASALPAPGPANPSLTTAALALRLAEHLGRQKG